MTNDEIKEVGRIRAQGKPPASGTRFLTRREVAAESVPEPLGAEREALLGVAIRGALEFHNAHDAGNPARTDERGEIMLPHLRVVPTRAETVRVLHELPGGAMTDMPPETATIVVEWGVRVVNPDGSVRTKRTVHGEVPFEVTDLVTQLAYWDRDKFGRSLQGFRWSAAV